MLAPIIAWLKCACTAAGRFGSGRLAGAVRGFYMTVLSSFWNWTVVSMRFNHINYIPLTTGTIISKMANQLGLRKIVYLVKNEII